MKNRNSRKKPRCLKKFRFVRNRFEIGYQYAALVNGHKVVGLFGKRSKVKANTVTLFVPTEYGKAMKQIHVPKAAIIADPWAAVQNLFTPEIAVPREEPPKCILFKKPTMCARRYGGEGAQHKAKGIKVKPVIVMEVDDSEPVYKVKVKSRINAASRAAVKRR